MRGFVFFMISSCTCKLQRDGPVSMVMMHVWFVGLRGHFGEIAGKNKVRLLFLLTGFFSLVGILGYGFGV